jgi:hypothetical protein
MSNYSTILEAAITELADLMRERELLDARRENLNERIIRVREGVVGLSSLAGHDPDEIRMKYANLFPELIDSDIGFTDAVRKVLAANATLMTPVGVRTGLRTLGFDLDRYSNPLASIHTVLKRLVESGEAEIGTVNESTAYRWKNRPEFSVANAERATGPGAFKHSPLKHIGQRPKWRQHLNKAKKKD